jgi:hypothetical protein
MSVSELKLNERLLSGKCRLLSAILVLLANVPWLISLPVQSEVLQGRIEHEHEILRLAPPQAGPPGQPGTPAGNQGHSLRISREALAPLLNSQSPMVDPTAFSQPLAGRADQNDVRLGVLKPNQFALPPQNKFDIGAERGSREMMIAWERWHHQLSEAIYQRWSERAQRPGRATLRITVTRDRHIIPKLVGSAATPEFNDVLIGAIMSLDHNPGLAFPSKSVRQEVSFEADYIASHDVNPGFSWVKNDYEKIHQQY